MRHLFEILRAKAICWYSYQTCTSYTLAKIHVQSLANFSELHVNGILRTKPICWYSYQTCKSINLATWLGLQFDIKFILNPDNHPDKPYDNQYYPHDHPGNFEDKPHDHPDNPDNYHHHPIIYLDYLCNHFAILKIVLTILKHILIILITIQTILSTILTVLSVTLTNLGITKQISFVELLKCDGPSDWQAWF